MDVQMIKQLYPSIVNKHTAVRLDAIVDHYKQNPGVQTVMLNELGRGIWLADIRGYGGFLKLAEELLTSPETTKLMERYNATEQEKVIGYFTMAICDVGSRLTPVEEWVRNTLHNDLLEYKMRNNRHAKQAKVAAREYIQALSQSKLDDFMNANPDRRELLIGNASGLAYAGSTGHFAAHGKNATAAVSRYCTTGTMDKI